MLGEKLTHIDFIMYEFLVRLTSVIQVICMKSDTTWQFMLRFMQDFTRMLVPDILDPTPSLNKYLEKFESLPRVGDFLRSDRFERFPIFGERSYLGRLKGDCDDHK